MPGEPETQRSLTRGGRGTRGNYLSFWLVSVSCFLVLNARADYTNCVTPPWDLVSWWRAEGNGLDVTAANPAALVNATTFAPGMVGYGFQFNGASDYAVMSASGTLNVGPGPGLTLEAWVNPADTGNGHSVFEWGPSGGSAYGVHFWVGHPGHKPGYFFANVVDTSGGYHVIETADGLLQSNVFQHVALTYDAGSGVARLFLNGVVVAENNLGTFTPQTSYDLVLGGRVTSSGPSFLFKGVMDEVAVYRRALDVGEIQAIFAAGSDGKCVGAVPPFVAVPPGSRSAYVGDTVSFTVNASGSPPLAYWWYDNHGAEISGANGATLVLPGVQIAQAGNYSVVVSNEFGVTPAVEAALTVISPPACLPPFQGLLGMWRGDNDARDSVGLNHGWLMNSPGWGPGAVRQAFVFDGTNQYVEIPDGPTLNPVNGLTLEAWIKLGVLPTNHSMTVLAKDDEGANHQYLLSVVASQAQAVLQARVRVQTQYVTLTGARPLGLGGWHHVALTYHGAALTLYVDGVANTNVPAGGPISRTSQPLRIARGGPLSHFAGSIDEVSLYGRGLSASEILSLYNAGGGGKCLGPVAPSFLVNPTNQVVATGASVTFYSLAGGTAPVNYQWRLNGTNLLGATNNSLILTNVQIRQAGNYAVEANNAGGAVLSSNATLGVTFLPAVVRVGATNGVAGSILQVPLLVAANGNENAVSLSLNYDTTKLQFTDARPANTPTGTMLLLDTVLTNNGKIGLAVVLPPGTTLSPGTQAVANLSFTAAMLTNSAATAMSFGDQPTLRQIFDDHLGIQPAYYSNAIISIAAAEYEGDIFPRPGGDRNLTLADWLLMGRYAARLDFPTNASEFQRADCAPRSSLGDGLLGVTDWVQAGRYIFGLDPPTSLGGPFNQGASPGPSPSATRVVAVADATLVPQQPLLVSVNLVAQGDENALGFSLTFDPARASFAGVGAGRDAGGATLYVNSSQVTAGRIGVALALAPGTTFPQGPRELAKFDFIASAGAGGSFSPAFGDLPVPREVSDANASVLPAGFVLAGISNAPAPSLRIVRSGENVVVAWPAWAGNYGLQETTSLSPSVASWTNVNTAPLLINNERVTTLPPGGAARFYRLIRQ